MICSKLAYRSNPTGPGPVFLRFHFLAVLHASACVAGVVTAGLFQAFCL